MPQTSQKSAGRAGALEPHSALHQAFLLPNSVILAMPEVQCITGKGPDLFPAQLFDM